MLLNKDVDLGIEALKWLGNFLGNGKFPGYGRPGIQSCINTCGKPGYGYFPGYGKCLGFGSKHHKQ